MGGPGDGTTAADTALTAGVVAERIAAAGLPRPEWAVVLGTGLGALAELLTGSVTVPYADLPGFPAATAPGHEGRLVVGELLTVPVAMLSGRAHLYEGRTEAEATFAVRTLAALGVPRLILANASGGLLPSLTPGDVVLIDDHIDLLRMRRGTLASRVRIDIGQVGGATAGLPSSAPATSRRLGSDTAGQASSGTRRRNVYDADLAERLERAARRQGVPLVRGTYVAVPGPNYETRAEYRAFRRLGGTVVGMSTVPEALAAARAGMRVAALSVVGNVATPDAPSGPPTTTEAVEAAAARGADLVGTLILALVMSTVDDV